MKTQLKGLVERFARYTLNGDAHDIQRAMQRRALEDTSRFVEENMFLTPSYGNKFQLLAAAILATRENSGMYCEFGVHNGTTINYIADRVKGEVYGFDSFAGLPEDWRPGMEKGHFKRDTLPRVRANVQLVTGWFHESLPPFLEQRAGHCAFVHVDCDLYSSTRTVFEHLGSRIRPGTVVVFDEFFNYPNWRKGEFLAFQELLAKEGLTFEYLGYVASDEQVAVRITSRAADSLPASERVPNRPKTLA
jgi:hypothetical protein